MLNEKVRKRNAEIGAVLAQAKIVTQEQIARLGRDCPEDPIEDMVIVLGMAAEPDVVKVLAAHFRTRFVGTESLSKVEVPAATLSTIPRKVAEAFGVFPVLLDVPAGAVSVVTSDPANSMVLEEIKMASGLREVRPLFARPAAIRAAIEKFYGGDKSAFDKIDRGRELHQMMTTYGRDRGPLSQPKMRAVHPHLEMGAMPLERISTTMPSMPAVVHVSADVVAVDPARQIRALSQPPPAVSQPPTERSVAGAPKDATLERVVEVLNVMVSLLENERADLRGHSAQTARIARRLAERLKFDPPAISAVAMAGHLHDVGKMGTYHLTPFNASEYAGHKLAAQKSVTTPARLLESAHLPKDTVLALQHMYERFDGKGFPDSLRGKDIPLGARVLSVADTYADLTQNPKNPKRKVLSGPEAIAVLAQYKDAIFDPHIVDLLGTLVLSDDVKARLLQTKYTTLLVDADSEETTVLELRLFEQGFDVRTARSVDAALKILAEVDVDLVISELELPSGDGLQLLAQARTLPKSPDVAWVVYTRRQERADAQKAFELGAADFVQKPAPTDILVQKLRALMDLKLANRKAAAHRGVSGSLKEMGLPDLLQILFHSRKSGNLRITSAKLSGEIHVEAGNVFHAICGTKRGEEAFFSILKLQDGEFSLDPDFKVSERTIRMPAEALLLEAMRRLDEGI